MFTHNLHTHTHTGDEPPSLTTSALELGTMMALPQECLHTTCTHTHTGDEPPSLTTSALELGTMMALSQKEERSLFPAAQRCGIWFTHKT